MYVKCFYFTVKEDGDEMIIEIKKPDNYLVSLKCISMSTCSRLMFFTDPVGTAGFSGIKRVHNMCLCSHINDL